MLICESGETTATVFESLVIQNGRGQLEEIAGEQFEIGGGMFNNDSSSPTLTTARSRAIMPTTAAGCTTNPAARP